MRVSSSAGRSTAGSSDPSIRWARSGASRRAWLNQIGDTSSPSCSNLNGVSDSRISTRGAKGRRAPGRQDAQLTSKPLHLASSTSSVAKRVFPTPGSPSMRATPPGPARTLSTASIRSRRSSSLPTNGESERIVKGCLVSSGPTLMPDRLCLVIRS